MQIALANEAKTEKLGEFLGSKLKEVSTSLMVVFLHGDLGMGKTTLTRAVLRGLGHKGSVKSPTYTLVEEYDIDKLKVFHFDLYRLADAEELEFMGIRDFLSPEMEASGISRKLCIVEWPEKGLGMLPKPDLDIELQPDGEGRVVSLRLADDNTLDFDLSDIESMMEEGYV
jgi:tRNA threonylcarbamoyladenosine biosynthesis protein TsaE